MAIVIQADYGGWRSGACGRSYREQRNPIRSPSIGTCAGDRERDDAPGGGGKLREQPFCSVRRRHWPCHPAGSLNPTPYKKSSFGSGFASADPRVAADPIHRVPRRAAQSSGSVARQNLWQSLKNPESSRTLYLRIARLAKRPPGTVPLQFSDSDHEHTCTPVHLYTPVKTNLRRSCRFV